MKKLELKQMESLEGRQRHLAIDKGCAAAIGFALVTCAFTGGWSVIGAAMVCSTNAY